MASTRPKILTIKDKEKFISLLKPCQDVEVKELISADFKKIIADLDVALEEKLPGIYSNPPSHKTPAYLTANQIGADKKIMLLYLPERQSRIVMVNPTYFTNDTEMEEKPEYRISTFFADQFRFSSLNYQKSITVYYNDIYGKTQSLNLKNEAAIAAQMGIQFVHGVTPFDHISKDELTNFPNQPGTSKFITTFKAYHFHNRQNEIKTNNPQFDEQPEQLSFLKDFLALREKYPCIVETTKQKEEQTNSLRVTPSL